ncbi:MULTISPECIES: lipocalin-like domain-containing protein [unclassified Janthinobacterium]|uniref:lipocalin-like domain-containing protein n=1 Tax=unclassified Janthinobacterium TaxID=2610881 RepID=UPI00034CFB4C|nr:MULTISPECIES: carotenoid 1,2-hydratase [unclassified Janthinobacterium]MEC5160659.1 putative secreted hydrolase [Janthinobacterium sp. CG_S6]
MTRALLALLLLLAQLALAAAPAFAPVTPLAPGQSLRLPADFGAHPDYKTEWWYATGWLTTAAGKQLGYQVTFFRSATEHDRANPSAFAPQQLIIGHVALSDPAVGKLLHDQKSAREGFGLAYAKVGDTDVKLDGWRMARAADGSYQITVAAREFSLQLRLAPSQPVLPQGQRGYSRKGPHAAQASYYYSEPQLRTSGSVTRAGAAPQAVSGVTWLDHEWSSQALDPDASGWDWVGANLDGGGALMAFQIRSRTGAKLWAHATLRDASGKMTQFAPEQVSFAPRRLWRSPRTNAQYPVATQLTTGGTTWQITPLQDDQELDSRRSTGAVYWEGAVTISRDGAPAGRAYLEMTGYDRPMKL